MDTQFAVDEWLAGEPLDGEVREQLAPFNRVRVGSGYPDLVGVRTLEAKDRSRNRAVDVAGDVVQAYDRLDEANTSSVPQTTPGAVRRFWDSSRSVPTALRSPSSAKRSSGSP